MTHATEDGLELGFMEYCINAQMPRERVHGSDAPSILTALERTVFARMLESASGNGYDFGLIEECRDAIPAGRSPRALSGVVASLVKKGFITVHDAVKTSEATWTQFTVNVDKLTDFVMSTDDMELSGKCRAALQSIG